MGHKNAADKRSYLTRSGSHSTKPNKRGDNAHLATQRYDVNYSAPRVVDRAAQVAEIDRQIEERKVRQQGLTLQVQELKGLLSTKLPFQRFAELSALRNDVGSQLDVINRELGELRRMRHKLLPLRTGSFEQIFTDVARDLLPKEVWVEISNAAHDIMRQQGLLPPETKKVAKV